MRTFVVGFLVCMIIPTAFLQASNSDPYDQFEEELTKAAETRQFISNEDLYGHDTNRSTSGSHDTRLILSVDSTCQLEKTGPNPFFTNKSYRKTKVQSGDQCRPQAIAKQIKENLPRHFCSEKSQNEFYHYKKDEYSVSITSAINYDCLCFKKFYANTWSAFDNILHPLNLLFNGPDYHRVTTLYSLAKEECVQLADSAEEKEAIANAYDSRSNE